LLFNIEGMKNASPDEALSQCEGGKNEKGGEMRMERVRMRGYKKLRRREFEEERHRFHECSLKEPLAFESRRDSSLIAADEIRGDV
jgi:hypothetical protein